MNKTRYPWAEWFNGQEYVLVRGRDFELSVDNMRRQITARAHDHGVRIDMVRGEDIIVLRARPRLILPANDSLQGGEVATQRLVKPSIAGSNPAPAAEVA